MSAMSLSDALPGGVTACGGLGLGACGGPGLAAPGYTAWGAGVSAVISLAIGARL